MKFRSFKEFRAGSLQDVVEYLKVHLTSTLRDLVAGLTKLTFTDNFDAFEAEVTIGAGSEAKIRNELSTIPTKRMIVRALGSSDIIDGPTAWNKDFVYLKNNGGASATISVVFMR